MNRTTIGFLTCSFLLTFCLSACGRDGGETAHKSAAKSEAVSGLALGNYHETSIVAALSELTAANSAVNGAIQRKIIYKSDIELIVEDLDTTREKLAALIKQHKAYVSESEISGASGSQRSATWTIRIPVDQFEPFRGALLDLGIPKRDSLSSEDVTEKYYDLKARISNSQKEEQELLELRKTRAKDLKDILAANKEVSRVRGEIERMQGQIQLLRNLTSLTTVNLTLHERKDYVPPQAATFTTRISQTFSGSLEALGSFGRGLVIFVVAVAPWLPILALGVGVPWWRIRRSRRRRKDQPSMFL